MKGYDETVTSCVFTLLFLLLVSSNTKSWPKIHLTIEKCQRRNNSWIPVMVFTDFLDWFRGHYRIEQLFTVTNSIYQDFLFSGTELILLARLSCSKFAFQVMNEDLEVHKFKSIDQPIWFSRQNVLQQVENH